MKTSPDPARLLYALGLALAFAGMLGPVFTIASARWGDPNWEVAFFGQFSATLALLMIGIGILAFMGARRGSRIQLWLLAGACAVLGVFAMVGALLVALNLPLAWEAAQNAPNPDQATGLKILTMKALALCGVWGFGNIVLALKLGFAGRARRNLSGGY